MKAELRVCLMHEYIENIQFVPSKLGVHLIHDLTNETVQCVLGDAIVVTLSVV